MIGPTGAVRVMVATRPVDFRKGAEGLAALVRETMTADPFSGASMCSGPSVRTGSS
jgi:transposase